jgi:hypothetical protein
MNETFDTYTQRTLLYKILSASIVCFMALIFTCIFFQIVYPKFFISH